jgi:hypothetical protein
MLVKLARGARFRQKAQCRVLLGQEVRVNDLHGHGATEDGLFRAVDPAHAADTDEVHDVVARRQRRADEAVPRLRVHRADGKTAGRAVAAVRRARLVAVGARADLLAHALAGCDGGVHARCQVRGGDHPGRPGFLPSFGATAIVQPFSRAGRSPGPNRVSWAGHERAPEAGGAAGRDRLDHQG